MLVLLVVALWFILRGDFVLCLTLCYFVLVFFSPFSIATTSLREERELILVLFVRLFDLCLFAVSSSAWCLGRVVVCDCGTHWTFLFFFFFFFFFCSVFLLRVIGRLSSHPGYLIYYFPNLKNPCSAAVTKLICKFIQEALKLR